MQSAVRCKTRKQQYSATGLARGPEDNKCGRMRAPEYIDNSISAAGIGRDVTQQVLAIKEQRRTVPTTATCGGEWRTSEQEKIPGHYWHLARVRSM